MESPFNDIKQGEYTIKVNNKTLIVNVIQMQSTVMLWIGSVFNTSYNNLSVSIDRGFDQPSTSVLLSGKSIDIIFI